jgi:hypothetical protein
MSTLTIRLPDDTAQRLKSLAQSRGLSMTSWLSNSARTPCRPGTPKTTFARSRQQVMCNRRWRCLTVWTRQTSVLRLSK